MNSPFVFQATQKNREIGCVGLKAKVVYKYFREFWHQLLRWMDIVVGLDIEISLKHTSW